MHIKNSIQVGHVRINQKVSPLFDNTVMPNSSATGELSFLPLRGIKSNLLLFMALFFLSIAAFQMHEIGHYVLGKISGLNLSYEYSHVRTVNQTISQTQKFFFVLGGPLVTYFFSFLSILLVIRHIKPCFFLLFGLSNAFLRARAMLKCVVNLEGFQDEVKLASMLGLPAYSLAWGSLLLAVVLIGCFLFLTPNNKFRVLLFCMLNSFIGPGLVFLLIPYLS